MFRHLIKQGILGLALFSFLSSFNIAVAASQDELTKNFLLAQNLAQKGDVDQAIAVYTSLIKTNPQLPEAYNNLAALYLQQKNTKQAKLILEQGLSAHKGYGSLYESLTAINVAMAREAYSKALQIELKSAEITIASLSLSSSKVISENNSLSCYSFRKKYTGSTTKKY
jgi:tetratricopeptide (TPR) repeat protein